MPGDVAPTRVDPGHQFLARVATLREAHARLDETGLGGDSALVELAAMNGEARLYSHRLISRGLNHRGLGRWHGTWPKQVVAAQATPLERSRDTPAIVA